jgi:hypothetical protein
MPSTLDRPGILRAPALSFGVPATPRRDRLINETLRYPPFAKIAGSAQHAARGGSAAREVAR